MGTAFTECRCGPVSGDWLYVGALASNTKWIVMLCWAQMVHMFCPRLIGACNGRDEVGKFIEKVDRIFTQVGIKL
ncbi:MAG: hypothetical protein DRR04_13405 [Gammaproteobacteria bacterium]|nr:MAG: hypothetical protein DRR04_13405 [Gammaproteobacteria bacterium]